MRSLVSALLFTSASLTITASAFADDQTTTPVFALMDNTGDGSKLDLSLAAILPIDGPADTVGLRSSFLGQYVAPNGLGGYAGISASALISDNDFARGTDLGNVELGGLYQRALSPHVDLGVRMGLVLPTTRDNGALLHLVSTLLARPADLATAGYGTTWLRLGISPTYHRGPLLLRADLGVDVPTIDTRGADPVEHLNLGAGIEQDRVSLAAELQTVFVRTWGDGGVSSFRTAALTARYQGRVSPYVSVSTPVDHELRSAVVTMTAGLTVPF